ncbi:hypothetical protein ACIBW9_21040 [Streptomyces sp. NPDC049541]|uniref:hypothetical protein n=1 Tax=Streptomyces sp. NPDC049541 TaxID=3365594 RepID=UPI0037B8702D
MRRWVCCAVLLGAVAFLGSATPASAGDKCGGDFPARLRCWADRLEKGEDLKVVLDHELKADGSQKERDEAIGLAEKHAERLEVQVPAGVTTGEGGTVLLMLAAQNHRLVDPEAVITPLSPSTRAELKNVCKERQSFCRAVDGKSTLTGGDLIGSGMATSQHESAVGSREDNGNGDKWLLFATATALILLLAAFVLAVRRTRTAPAAPAVPAARTADEPTRALRANPAPSRARRPPTARVGPTHPATLRTPLHPQGYVELDRVLYRAVWAEPAEPPPAPGSRVDVADPPDPGSDVLYAYPPAPARHARAH